MTGPGATAGEVSGPLLSTGSLLEIPSAPKDGSSALGCDDAPSRCFARAAPPAATYPPPEGIPLSSTDPIRLVLVEDHVALRTALEMLLGRHGCVIIGRAATAAEAEPLMRRMRPDVAIVDVHLPDESGIAMSKRLLEEDPELGILLYTGADDRETLQEALDCGARGLALKVGAHDELARAVRTIAVGGTHLDPRLSTQLAAASSTGNGAPTPREREILQLLAGGLTGEQAAEKLVLSATTVQTHVRNAMRRLGARTRVEAITLALARRYISLPATTSRD